MTSDKQLQQAALALATRTQQLLNFLGLHWKLNVEEGQLVDPGIEFDGTGVGIMVMWGEQPSIIGPKPQIQYGAYVTSHDPGDRTTPPSEDTEVLGEPNANMDIPLTLAIKKVVELHIDNLVQAEADEEFEKSI